MRIGIFDSGVGGLTVLKKLINEKDGYIKGIVESIKYYIAN